MKALFSSKRYDWETPIDLFDQLNTEFRFTLDACGEQHNAKCSKYFTSEQDGLKQDCQGETVFCNPPYGRTIYNWVKKCFQESRKEYTKVVMLIPARTDTRYFHEFIYNIANETRFLKGRLRFSNSKHAAPFPSMIVIFYNSDTYVQTI